MEDRVRREIRGGERGSEHEREKQVHPVVPGPIGGVTVNLSKNIRDRLPHLYIISSLYSFGKQMCREMW